MLSGELERKLRKLNSKLRIFCGDDDSKAAGVYHTIGGEYQLVCGVDKNWVGEYPIMKADGQLAHSGWRRVLRILLQEGLVDRKRAERVFNTNLKTANFRLAAKRAKPKRDLLDRFTHGGTL